MKPTSQKVFLRFEAQLQECLKKWVEEHPDPDKPSIISPEGDIFTPRNVYEEVIKETDIGISFLESWLARLRRPFVKGLKK